ncbi:methyltransferase domain-containing protein [Lyngbya aestuarii]|uniref:methyltransferase domain-containing protein n=1 Tax=Lyngbya aestuarii TaxID=118322 RepID=UPI00403DEA75
MITAWVVILGLIPRKDLPAFQEPAIINQLTPQEQLIASRFNQHYRGEAFELPAEVEAMPIFQDWVTDKLTDLLVSPFWEMQQPKKNQHCLDIGCGVSFLVYLWRDWGAFFYGQEISTVAQQALNTRAPQLNSKLFNGVKFGSAQEIQYDDAQFDLVIATGWSCYYPPDYWLKVMQEVKRVLKPEGVFVFDILNPEKPLAEDWAVLETYLGAEVFFEPLVNWDKVLKESGAKVIKQSEGELFELYKTSF